MPVSQSYSKSFRDLISDKPRLQELLQGSLMFTEPWSKEKAWQEWESQRRFIAQAINQDGSFLDYGCANAFFLKCLKEWSSCKLDVYGIDVDENALKKARELFPSAENHFTSQEDISNNPEYPREFNTIYWNVWDDYNFEDGQEKNLLKSLLKATRKGGRLILGFYDTKEKNLKTIEQLKGLGYTLSGILENPSGGQEVVVWFDKAA